jgi:hypothetical protein
LKKLTLAVLAGAAVSIAACGGNKGNNTAGNGSTSVNGSAAASEATSGDSGGSGAGASAASAWPKGTRIVEEGGVTYRIAPDGARVRMEAADGRVVVENGVRYHVTADGARVRLDERGVRIGDSVIKGNAPNGGSDVETPGEAATDALEDAVEAVGDVDNPPRR